MSAIEAAIGKPSSLDARYVVAQKPRRGLLITFRDPVRYSDAWALQQQFHAERLSGSRTDTLILLEHLPVYTAGRRTRPGHLHPAGDSSGAAALPIETVSRGGSVTYHGPGQLVGYPILALSHFAPGARIYVYMLEEVLIRTLLHWDINGYRLAKTPGVWTRGRQGHVKLASIGARIDQGVTLHGFALNVSTDLRAFSRIVPCGLDGCRMSSIAESRQELVPVQRVAEQLAKDFSAVFKLEWETALFDRLSKDTGIETEPGAPMKED